MTDNVWTRLRQALRIESEAAPVIPKPSDCERFSEMLSMTDPGYAFIFEGNLFKCEPAKGILEGKRVHAVEFGCTSPLDGVRDPRRISWVMNHVTVKEGDGKFTVDYRCF